MHSYDINCELNDRLSGRVHVFAENRYQRSAAVKQQQNVILKCLLKLYLLLESNKKLYIYIYLFIYSRTKTVTIVVLVNGDAGGLR